MQVLSTGLHPGGGVVPLQLLDSLLIKFYKMHHSKPDYRMLRTNLAKMIIIKFCAYWGLKISTPQY